MAKRTDLLGDPIPGRIKRRAGDGNIVDVEAELRHETPGDNGAFLIFDGTKEVWVPKSLVEHDPHDSTFAMPEWLAKREGLI
jgi:hypothetical protein